MQVIGVAFNDGGRGLVADFVKSYNVTFPVGYTDNKMMAGQFMQLSMMRPNYVPFLAVIDQNGMVRAQGTQTEPLVVNEATAVRAELDKLLKAAPGAAKKKAAPKKK